jgi:hypothetical protein
LDDLFRQDNLRQLKQRISIRTRLVPFTLQQTNDYITHRLGTVGREANELFPPDTIPMIYKLSRGIPRLINSVCDNALLLAFAQQAEGVSLAMLREVANDLDLADFPAEPEPEPVPGPAAASTRPASQPASQRISPPASLLVTAAAGVRAAGNGAVLASSGGGVASLAPPSSSGPGSSKVGPAPAEEETELAAVPAHSLQILDSYSERKGTMNLLTKWANRFRSPDRR